MPSPIYRWGMNIVVGLCLILFVLILTSRELPDLSFLSSDEMGNFKTIFISIVLEAFPFVLLGVLISAVLQSFVSEETIRKLTPKNPILGVLFACVMGIIFPLCECGMIPVMRRLMRKGMPVYIAVVFILVGPILNPVVYASTYMAFRSRPEIAYTRMGLAFVVAVVIGLLLARFLKRNPLRSGIADAAHSHSSELTGSHTHANSKSTSLHKHEHHNSSQYDHEHNHHQHEHDHHRHEHVHTHNKGGNRFTGLLSHASDEFFEMGKYLMIGAMLTALIQTFMNRESLVTIGEGPISSHLFMMGFAYVLSLCSTSDAFVASSFATTFSAGSLLTFLVFGPMLDIKGTLMMLSVFKARFVLKLSIMVIIIVLIGSFIFERLFL
jgi:uncharacterized membrane protein YraQ (UPF0718 family)